MPKSSALWHSFDDIMHKKLSQLNNSIVPNTNISGYLGVKYEIFLLASHAITTASQYLKLRSNEMKTPKYLFQTIFELKRQIKTNSLSEGTGVSSNIFESLANLPVALNQEEVFAPVGVIQVRDSKPIELLALQLHLVSSQLYSGSGNNGTSLTDLKQYQGLRPAILEDLSNYSLKILSTLPTPIRLLSLRSIWENASKIDLPNSYLVYKKLYQQVVYSITTEPMQIINQDDTICSLLESMVQAKFKSSDLISKLYGLLSVHGMDYQRYGVRLFNVLVQLEATSFATDVLEIMMRNSNNKLEYLITQSSKGKPFSLSDSAKDQLLKVLSESFLSKQTTNGNDLSKQQSQANQNPEAELSDDNQLVLGKNNKIASDLVLALFCFNREEKKTSYYRLLERLELLLLQDMQQNSDKISTAEAIALLQSYSLAGRYHLKLVQSFISIVFNHLDELNLRQLSTVIWSCARLYLKPEFLLTLIELYFIKLEKANQLTSPGQFALCRTLWSMAVLEVLDFDRYHKVQNNLYRSFHQSTGEIELKVSVLKMLTQIHTELKLVAAKANAASDSVNDLSIQRQQEVKHQSNQMILEELDNFIATSSKMKIFNRKSPFGDDLISSSWTHLDASRLLNENGINHENEKRLSNHYTIDIYIPPNLSISWLKAYTNGVAIELDGPSHFESYLHVSL
jgi:hypothetical protein